MIRELVVVRDADVVGTIHVDAAAQMSFAYDRAWLARADAFPISARLPLGPDPHDPAAAHRFFANLLPEGGVRRAVCQRLGLSEDNDVDLLAAIGGDCAGALSILRAGDAPPQAHDHAYERLGDARLRAIVADDAAALLAGGPATRLSLAGAQEKLPVAVLDGELHLPLASAPSTHILKLPHARYRHLPANEAFVLGLAARVGLAVVDAELLTRTRPAALLVRRYDRQRSDDRWPVERVHQEDLCQALGVPPSRKHEQEGGPTLAASIELVRGIVRQPLVDTRGLIEWQAFNITAGNSDGHGKNLSIVYEAAGARLAPFYDLVATRAYPALDRALAMGVGGTRDPDHVDARRWTALAQSLGIAPRLTLELVAGVAERTLEHVDGWAKEYRDRYGAQPILQTLPRQILLRARRVLRASRPARG